MHILHAHYIVLNNVIHLNGQPRSQGFYPPRERKALGTRLLNGQCHVSLIRVFQGNLYLIMSLMLENGMVKFVYR